MAHSYFYNLHDITTVRSNVHLPELQAFLSNDPWPAQLPNLDVRVGQDRSRAPSVQSAQPNLKSHRYIQYREGWGPFGFNAEINIRSPQQIELWATPILRFSPHVLYTNLVEPVLRWNFVEKGYALVHGACIASGHDAYLVTARTDTGKTTTILRILDGQRAINGNAAFLSDDLTLVSPNGTVLSYPKPLTISYHTVSSVNSPYLSRIERLTLPFQSRIHSRSGRRLALWLTRSKLPMATINTYIQLLVPPPKYHVDQLVPGVRVTKAATLAGLFVIERGGQGELALRHEEAMEILLSNCDDAYGFPPYNQIEGFLRQVEGVDLRDLERVIVTKAFAGLPATLLRSSTLDWAQRIPGLMTRKRSPAFQPAAELALAGHSAQ
jgi:dolichol-phosphate mannosyltransferase